MRVLHSWLQEYLPFDLEPAVLADRLSLLGLEMEGIEDLGAKFSGFVVGRVLEKQKHPNADKLSVCSVDVGKDKLQVVCGAPNVAAGQKVVVGTIGATVPRNQHDPTGAPLVLSRVAIRGVDSEGMICSSFELGIGEDADGILVLEDRARVGQDFSSYLGQDDVAYDIEITANRPDLLSHYGVAREIGAIVGRRPKLPVVRLKESGTPVSKALRITVEDHRNCPRFSARVIRGITLGPSPAWMQDRLLGVGLRPHNVIVDITNYVMLECGQPLHAFDHSLIEGGTIVVRSYPGPMRFTTLDGKQHDVPAGALFVCDAVKPISIAGIMGGENSEIRASTTDIVLESAYWNPSSIRRTRRALGIVTDASSRFERGADPEGSTYALDRAAQLVLEYAGGDLLKGKIDVYPRKFRPRRVAFRPERVNHVLGTSLKAGESTRFLKSLGITRAESRGKGIEMIVPTHRVDLEREIDLIEEVARVFGYNNIAVKTTTTFDLAHPFPKVEPASEIRDILAGFGYQEAITNSLQTEEKARSGMKKFAPVAVRNPQNREMSTLRTSLLPGLLDVVAHNQNTGSMNLRIFEIGHVFARDRSGENVIPGYLERSSLGVVLTGLAERRSLNDPGRQSTIFDLKGDIEDFLVKIILDKGRLISYSTTDTLAEYSLAIEINGGYAGFLGSVRSDVLKSFGIEQDVFIAEISLEALSVPHERRFKSLPKYPKVQRDVAFVVDARVTASDVHRCILEGASQLLHSVEIFDLYEGDKLDQGKKSLAFALELMSSEKTLTEGEIEAEIARIVKAVEQGVGGTLRGF